MAQKLKTITPKKWYFKHFSFSNKFISRNICYKPIIKHLIYNNYKTAKRSKFMHNSQNKTLLIYTTIFVV